MTRTAPRPWLTLAFLGVIVAAVGALGFSGFSYFEARDWRTVLTVDGERIDRAALRDRTALVQALLAAVDERARGTDAAQAAALTVRFAADPGEVAIGQLTEEVVLRKAAAERKLVVPPADPAAELAATVDAPASRLVRWVRLYRGSRSVGELDPLVATLRERLAAGATVADLRSLVPSDRRVDVGETWIDPDGGSPVDGSTPPATLIVAARGAHAGEVVPEAAADASESGVLALAFVVVDRAGTLGGADLLARAKAAGASEGGIAAWAAGQALRRAVEAEVIRTASAEAVRLAEIDLGPAPEPGPPTAEIAALTLARLPGEDGAALRAELEGLPSHERLARWDDLVARANAASPMPSALERSGEIGWFGLVDLVPELGTVVFPGASPGPSGSPSSPAPCPSGAAGCTPPPAGAVIGPIATSVGPQLFLVLARFEGAIGERAAAIVAEARTTADWGSLVARVAPDSAAGLSDAPWRPLAALTASVADALRSAAPGDLVGPLVVDGRLVFGRLLERADANDAGAEARILLGAYREWLVEAMAAVIVAQESSTAPIPLSST